MIARYVISDINRNRSFFDMPNFSAIIKDITFQKPNAKGAKNVY